MTIEQEMRNEVKRLENELFFLDQKLEKMKDDLTQLLMQKRKKEQDVRILKSSVGIPVDEKEFQTNLLRLLKK